MGEFIYERELKRALDEEIRTRIEALLEEQADNPFVSFEHRWDDSRDALLLDSKLGKGRIAFDASRVEVEVWPSLAGRLFDTLKNRKKLAEALDQVVTRLDM